MASTARSLSILAVLVIAGCGDDGSSVSGDAGGSRDAGGLSDVGPTGGDDAAVEIDAGETHAFDAGIEGPAVCPLSPSARTLLHELADELVADSIWVSTRSHARESAFALSLLGVEEGNLGVASLAFDCDAELWYVPYCSEGGEGGPSGPFWETRDRCGRAGCAAAGVDLQQTYMTMQPRTDPDDRHVFTYPLTTLEGDATWDPNPLQLWRIEKTATDGRRTIGEIDRQVAINLASGESLDMAHTGSANVLVEGGEIVSFELVLELPDLAPPDPVSVVVTIDAAGTVGGMIYRADEILAVWGGTHDAPLFVWLGDCNG